MIMDAIASHLVLPNRLTVPLVANLHVAQLRSPLPRVIVLSMAWRNMDPHRLNLSQHITCKQTRSLKVIQHIYLVNEKHRTMFCEEAS